VISVKRHVIEVVSLGAPFPIKRPSFEVFFRYPVSLPELYINAPESVGKCSCVAAFIRKIRPDGCHRSSL
jgi:hypothetical protein